jgi:hypothetical protein
MGVLLANGAAVGSRRFGGVDGGFFSFLDGERGPEEANHLGVPGVGFFLVYCRAVRAPIGPFALRSMAKKGRATMSA